MLTEGALRHFASLHRSSSSTGFPPNFTEQERCNCSHSCSRASWGSRSINPALAGGGPEDGPCGRRERLTATGFVLPERFSSVLSGLSRSPHFPFSLLMSSTLLPGGPWVSPREPWSLLQAAGQGLGSGLLSACGRVPETLPRKEENSHEEGLTSLSGHFSA